jgi:hypothetical protein
MHAARCPESPAPEKRASCSTGRVFCRRDPRNPRWTLCVRFCVSKEDTLANRCGASMWDSFQTAWDMLKTEQNLIDEDERLVYPFQITTAQEEF